ncbi:MAG: Fur family transcriptional regulator [Bacillota bacterium]
MEEKLLRDLRSRIDFRLTEQRGKILSELFAQEGKHLLAQDIYDALKEKGSKVGLATVYRTLDLFEEEGIIAKRKFAGESAYYEIELEPQQQHHHLICKSCGRVIEVTDLLSQNTAEELLNQEGFKVEDLCLQIYGYCEQCRVTSDE